MAVSDDIAIARNALRTRRDDAARALFARETARQNLDAAARQFAAGSPELAQAQAAFDSADGDLETARADEARARATLNGAIGTWLTDPATGQPLAPDADYARMALTAAPVALFPVRLETRFDVPARTLRVRVYPDDFLADIHERELTPEEQAAGAAYWDQIPPPDNSGHIFEKVDRWTTVAKRFGVPRAAYIVRVTQPSEDGPPPPRATTPSRAAEAVLPDRWVVLAFKNGDLRQTRVGAPIPEPLSLTPNPSDDAQTLVEVADTFTVPSTISWTVKYDDARTAGMAIDVDNLADDEVTGGFDRVVVLGVKTSMDPATAAELISDLFDAHHYTRGLDLVPQGTPTNNIPGRPTPFTMNDPSAAESFQIERVGPAAGDLIFDPDFFVLSDAFGYDHVFGPFTFLRGARELQRQNFMAQNMRRVLWPVTLGYFMRQMMNPSPFLNGDTGANPLFPEATIQRARDFFFKHVCAQGPVPAFRVGAVPYGVLPALSLSRMVAQTGEDLGAIDVMRRLLAFWQAAAASVPTVPRTSPDRNTDLMRVISQKPGSDGVFVRNSLGVQTAVNLLQLALQDVGGLLTALAQLANPVSASLGHPEWANARIFGLSFLPAIAQFAGPLVTAHPQQQKLVSAVFDPAHPDDTTALNYLAFLGDLRLPLDTIGLQTSMLNVAPLNEPIPLLYLLARHALLLQVVEIGRKFLPASFAPLRLIDFELSGITIGENRPTVFSVLSSRPSGSPASVYELIRANSTVAGGTLDPNQEYGDFLTALQDLSGQLVPDLERMLTETIDLASHRLDAWITALATRRLRNYRTSEFQAEHATTTYFGAYGFVEDVRPTPRTTRPLDGVGTVEVQQNNGGFIHAPSLRHGTAAAILRSGRLAEKADPTKYAIELPSERARRARSLVDGVRAGQPLGALLGYELERGLRARGVAGTEGFILALRNLYPQVANKSGVDPGQPADRIAGRNVVDGQRVRQTAATAPGIPFGTAGLPPSGSAGQRAISAEIARVDEIMDGIGDLVTAEAIYQVAAGDVLSAEAAMNFLPSGNNPPELEVTDSPAAGVAVSHRVAVIIEGTNPPPATGWSVGASPRGQADPFVDAWVGSLLGEPIGATATIHFHSGGAAAPPARFALTTLQLGALDFVALAQSTAATGQGSPLERRIAAAFLAQHAGATDIAISYDTPAAPGRSIPQLIELGRAVGAVLGSARELGPADLRRAEDSVDDAQLAAQAADVLLRANTALGNLVTARAALDGPDARSALVGAAAYLADAFPAIDASAGDLEVALAGARGELGRRVNDAQVALAAAGGSNALTISGAIAALRAVFGASTLGVLPAAVPQGGDELRQSLAALARPLNLADPTAIDAHQAPGRFLQQASRVHEHLGPWRRLCLYRGASGAPAPHVAVAQLPFVGGEDWAGRSPPTASRTSLLLVSGNGQTADPDPSVVWRGLLLDQWTEVVPGGKAETALAFHYDSQNAEAPQVILMAMHSGQPGGWNLTELQSIVNETMNLALIRPVDSDLVALGQLVPPICVASNPENKTVSTTFGPSTVQAPPIVG